MAIVLGNLGPLLDVSSPRTVSAERKSSPSIDVFAASLTKRDIHVFFGCVSYRGSDCERDSRPIRHVVRGKTNSKVNAVDFDSGSSEEDGNGYGNGNGFEEEDGFGWEMEMRRRLKELEEMRDLEKKAEELQNKAEEISGAEGKEETEEEKRMRVRKELEKVAQEQAERRATAQLMFELGQKAYEKGKYGRAIEFFEGVLTIIPRPTMFGGEIQIWLAMAYEANNRHADCIALYKQLENKHPMASIRRQAAELRYILQAPKLKISQEEMVTIPMIGSSYDSYAATWSDKGKDGSQRGSYPTTNQLPSSRDFIGDFLVWRPPVGLEKNRAFWVALALWLGLVGTALILQR